MATHRSSPLGRFLRFIAMVVGAVILAAIAAVWYFGPKESLAFVIRQGVTLAGFGPVEVSVTRLDPGGITLENFSAGRGGALVMRRATLDFKEGGPLAGAQGLVIDGLVYAATLGPGGFDSGFSLKPSSGGGAVKLPKLPFPVVVNDSRGRLNTPYGALDVVSALAARFDQGALRAAYDLSFSPDAGGAGAIGAHRGTLSMTSDPEGSIDLALEFAPGGARAAQGAGTPPAPGNSPPAPAAAPARATSGKGGTFKLSLIAKGNPETGPFEVHAALQDVKLPAFEVALQRANADAVRAAGEADYTLTVAMEKLDAFAAAVAEAAITGRVETKDGVYSLHLPDCARVMGVTYRGTATPLHADLPKLCGAIASDTVATLDRGELDFAVRVLDAKVSDAQAGGPAGFEGTLPQITFTAQNGRAGWHGALNGDGGDLHAVDVDIVFNDILLDGEFSAPAAEPPRGRFSVSHLLMSSLTTPAVFSPLTLKGDVTLADNTLDFQLAGAMEGIEKLASFTGSHTIASGVGEAVFDLPKLVFAPGGLQPGALAPAIAKQVRSASGELDARGKFAWTSEGATSDGVLNIKDLGGKAAFGQIAGMNGNIVFSSLVPPETKDSQTLNIKMLEAGLPLPDGVIKFKLLPHSRLVVERARWPLMGGEIGLSSAILDLERSQNAATLAVDGIDLAQLLVMVDVDGLSGTGTLNGRIPIRFEGNHQYIEGGKLSAQPPGGTLVYKSVTATATAGSGDQSKILFQALDNFQYQALDGSLDGDLAGDLSLKVHLKGHNPALYEGYPIELNVNTDGPFVAMLKKSLFAVHDVAQPQ